LSVLDSDRCKALFRKGQAMLQCKDLDGGALVLEEAQKLMPTDGMITKLIQHAQLLMKQREEREKKMYQRMFA
jgi:peptidyl-prolyl isomerase D